MSLVKRSASALTNTHLDGLAEFRLPRPRSQIRVCMLSEDRRTRGPRCPNTDLPSTRVARQGLLCGLSPARVVARRRVCPGTRTSEPHVWEDRRRLYCESVRESTRTPTGSNGSESRYVFRASAISFALSRSWF